MIPVFRPSMGQAEIDAVAEVLRSGWIGLGPKTKSFELALASYLGVPYVVAVNSCTAALHLALATLDLSPGDEVIVPTNTFVSTAHAVRYVGANPVFVDVDPCTLNISLPDTLRALSPRTRAIIPVHYAGYPVDMPELFELVCSVQNTYPRITLIEDCAHACGSTLYSKKCGSFAPLSCFSFHAVKNLSTGDGGAIAVKDRSTYERLLRLRWLGIDKSTHDRSTSTQYSWQYSVPEIGFKCHMNDIAAALGLVQLSRLDSMNAQRRHLAHRYSSLLSPLARNGTLELPCTESPDFQSAWHIFHIKTHRRDHFASALASAGVSTGVHYHPIHLYPCYDTSPYRHLPIALAQKDRILTLPLFPDMTEEEQDLVVSTLLLASTQG